jgi:tetratricopeptide (TPR) repeat protein
LTMAGNSQDAIPYLRRAVEIRTDSAEAFYNLGKAYIGVQRLNEAIDAWTNAVRIRPWYFEAHEGLGIAYYFTGDSKAALLHSRLALDGEPDRVSVLVLAASVMATEGNSSILRNGAEAVQLAERADQLSGGQDVSVLDTLSAAYAEGGHMEKAIETEERALSLAESAGGTGPIDRLKAHLAKYRAGFPLRCPPDEGTL